MRTKKKLDRWYQIQEYDPLSRQWPSEGTPSSFSWNQTGRELARSTIENMSYGRHISFRIVRCQVFETILKRLDDSATVDGVSIGELRKRKTKTKGKNAKPK